MFSQDSFIEQIHNFDSTNDSGERSPLLASNFIKINNLLNLLSSPQQQPQPQQQQQFENSTAMTAGNMMRIKSNESINNNDPGAFINSTDICCEHHRQTLPFITFPVRQTMSPQPSQLLPTGFHSRQNSSSNLLKTPSVLSRQSTVCYIYYTNKHTCV
jgi:hypothetical protein